MTGSYDDWIAQVFDQPVGDREWYGADDADCRAGNTAITTQFLGRMFRESGKLSERYSDQQISIGLNYTLGHSCSDHCLPILDSQSPWETRKPALAAIYHVFADLFAKRCTEHLCHLNEHGAGALNGICYMWRDIASIHGEPDNPACKKRDNCCCKSWLTH